MIRVHGIKGEIDTPIEEIFRLGLEAIGGLGRMVLSESVFRRSLDCRRKNNIHFVYSLNFELDDESGLFGCELVTPFSFNIPRKNTPKRRPVVVGLGPAGLFCSLVLARAGLCPVILERGDNVAEREKRVSAFWQKAVLEPNSNVQFGEGGAGTFSDGKLTTRVNDPLCELVLKELVRSGAPSEILYEAKPHIGTDVLRRVIQNISSELTRLGGEIHYRTRLEDIIINDGKISQISTNEGAWDKDTLFLCIGHSARDTFEMLHKKGIPIAAKPFSVGVRIEHLQRELDICQYGGLAGHFALAKADYRFVSGDKQNRLYSFCMCPGGSVIAAASEEGGVVTNGMSLHAREGENCNSAILVGVSPSDFPSGGELSGMAFQRWLEQKAFRAGYKAPYQLVGDFLSGKKSQGFGKIKPTYPLSVYAADFDELLPNRIALAMRQGLLDIAKKFPLFREYEAVMTGVETRSSSPIRIHRDDITRQSPIMGLYPCGEGAGYAGGIMSAAVDGIKSALCYINSL